MSRKEKTFHGKDSFERMNFLYQAATLMAGKNDVLSCYYGAQCKSVAKKSVLRMEPNVKRTICKRCSLVLRPGVTSDLSIESRHKQKSCQIKCAKCGCKKNFVLDENYKLWADNEASVKEVFTFTPDASSETSREADTANGPARNGS